jgi:hypothetical protein
MKWKEWMNEWISWRPDAFLNFVFRLCNMCHRIFQSLLLLPM